MSRSMELPLGWKRVGKKSFKGGQATAIPVLHDDGREGVYRQVKDQMSEVGRRRFWRELQILTHKVDHRAIVRLYDWKADSERPWYISEMGDPFDEWWLKFKKAHKDNPETLVDKAHSVLVELSSALSVCHSEGIVHRDIKPKNLIVKRRVPKPWPILIDFGIAHIESSPRLTLEDQAVGNRRFSPDVMRYRLEEVPPWLDVFELAQLLIWMLDVKAPKDHWQRPVHWKHVMYSDELPEDTLLAVWAFTAACSNEVSSPANGTEALSLLKELFPPRLALVAGDIDVNDMVLAKRRGESKKLFREAEIQEEIESCAPLAKKVYLDLRNELLAVLEEFSTVEFSARVLFDNQFQYQTIGATDLLCVSLGPPQLDIRLRIKSKLVTRSATTPANESNRAYWQEHMPKDAICFTFALEGGVVNAQNTRYFDGRWVTIIRNGTIYLHPLDAAFGQYSNNDLGGSAKGPGEPASMKDVRDFAVSVFKREKYWEYITAR